MVDDREPSQTYPSFHQAQPQGDDKLPLPDPYPEYVYCPHCGEPEVEVWCYQTGVVCPVCGAWIEHLPSECCGDETSQADPK